MKFGFGSKRQSAAKEMSYEEYRERLAHQLEAFDINQAMSGGLGGGDPVARSQLESQISQTFLNDQSIRLIEDQRNYARTIKWATWIIAVATMAQVAVALLPLLRQSQAVAVQAPPQGHTRQFQYIPSQSPSPNPSPVGK